MATSKYESKGGGEGFRERAKSCRATSPTLTSRNNKKNHQKTFIVK